MIRLVQWLCLLMGLIALLIAGIVGWTRREVNFDNLLLTRDENHDFYLMTPDGSFKHGLVNGEGRQLVLWLSEQSRLLYSERIQGSSAPIEVLYRHHPGAGAAQLIASVSAWNAVFPYMVAPDGKHIAYVGNSAPYTVTIINSAGKLQNSFSMTVPPFFINWTPDSRHIYYFECTGIMNCNLRLKDALQASPVKAIDRVNQTNVLWTPDMEGVIYTQLDEIWWASFNTSEQTLVVTGEEPLNLIATNGQALLYYDRHYMYWLDLDTRQSRQLLEFEFYPNSTNIHPSYAPHFYISVDAGSTHEIYHVNLDDGTVSLFTTVNVQARDYFFTYIILMPDQQSLLYGLQVDTLDGLNERIMVYQQVDLRTGEQEYLPVNGYTIPAEFTELKSNPVALLMGGLLLLVAGILPARKVTFG